MKEKIIEGLKKLDPAADAHWTKEGEVNLLAFKFIMGGEAVTREQVEEVAPGFNRTNADLPETPAPFTVSADEVHIAPATISGVINVASGATPDNAAVETVEGEKPSNVVNITSRIELADALKHLLSLAAEKSVIVEMTDLQLRELRETFAERRDHNIEIKNCIDKLLELEQEFMHDVEKELAGRRKEVPLHMLVQAQYDANAATALPVDRARPRAAPVVPPFRRS